MYATKWRRLFYLLLLLSLVFSYLSLSFPSWYPTEKKKKEKKKEKERERRKLQDLNEIH